jgi:hypothetical protein
MAVTKRTCYPLTTLGGSMKIKDLGDIEKLNIWYQLQQIVFLNRHLLNCNNRESDIKRRYLSIRNGNNSY